MYMDVNARYIAVAITAPSNKNQCALWYATAFGELLETPAEDEEPVVVTKPAIDIASASFIGYKGWCDAHAGGQDRYKQRDYSFTIRDSYPITNAYDGNMNTYASS